jgi:N-acetyl sugar amidotransferase
MEIQFCKRCLYSTAHPLGLIIDNEGICSGCRIHEEKDTLDWNKRFKILEDIVQPYRSKFGDKYDCIVPVTGANDSYYILDIVKNKLGLNPLLVTYNKYFNTPLGIRNLANLRIKFNCDILYQNINPLAVKNITRTTLRNFGSIYWPILAGQTVFPVQTAVKFKIPLIIWGAHQGLEQVGMFSHEHEVEMTRRYRKDHDLFGKEADDILSIFNSLDEKDIWQYRYPTDYDLNSVGVRGIYLGNYVRWDPKEQHEKMIKSYGYQTSTFARTFDRYDFVDCYNYMDIHDLLKLYKHGYSKVTDHASREIRFGRLTREEGLSLVRKHELAELQFTGLFCEWLGITEKALEFIMDQHRNPLFWHQVEPRKWIFKGWSKLQKNQNHDKEASKDILHFIENSTLSYTDEFNNYITIGKGWP